MGDKKLTFLFFCYNNWPSGIYYMISCSERELVAFKAILTSLYLNFLYGVYVVYLFLFLTGWIIKD